jgi:hypothetical protein
MTLLQRYKLPAVGNSPVAIHVFLLLLQMSHMLVEGDMNIAVVVVYT